MSEISIALPELRILLIDADRAFHALLQAAAKALPGAQILNCAAPGEALNRMDKFVPALFIIDGRIGGAAGINFVRRVRAGQTPAPAGTLVMFAAQDFSGGLSGKLVDVGCHAIVRKPLSPDALSRAIVRVFENPAPFVMGGAYLGPERRKPDAKAKHDPERRRTPTRGGYGATPKLPRDAMPMVTMAVPLGAKPAAKSAGIETGPAPGTRPKPGGGIEAIALPEPNQKERISLVDDAPAPAAAKQKQSLVDEAAPPAKQKREPQVLVDEPVKKKAPRDDAPMELAPPPKAPDKEPEFDVGAVVELHRQWIASNGAQGAKANLEGMALSGVSLSGQNLAKANLRGTDLSNADLSHCVLLDADMRNAILSQTVLNRAQMAGAKVRHADLQFAQLMETGLQGSDLAGADMRGAVLTGADLSGANLLGVDLRGADVMGINLTQKQLDRARGDHTTKLPPGLFVRMGEAIE
jgi:DNA-binding NarL/FixJ family response regulator